MTDAISQRTPASLGPPGRDVTWTAFGGYLLLGWTVLLVPSLIRDVERAFGQGDAGMGLAYFLSSALYVTGTLSVGLLGGRVPRRLLLGAGPGLMAAGMVVLAAAPGWPAFLAGFMTVGMGSGLVDAGINALFMDLYSGRQAGALNRLHLWVAVGALAAPLAVGRIVGAGAPWQAVILATAAAAGLLAIVLATRALPSVHRHPRPGSGLGDPASAPGPAPVRSRLRRLPRPLLVLSIAIACYIAMEMGVTNWLVRYLADAPLETATLALSLFWGSLAVGRLVSSFVADRMGAVRFASTWSVVNGLAIMASLAAPSVPVAIACFAIAGFAAGPVYPMIMAIAGSLYPGRASLVSGVLASAAIVGSLVYPPLMGLLSGTIGLGASMFGAGLFGIAAAVAIRAGARLGSPRAVVTARAAGSSQA